MKTIYEKSKNMAKYIEDLLFLNRYYLDLYRNINVKVRSRNIQYIPQAHQDDIRSYSLSTSDPHEMTFSSLRISTDYNSRYLFTLTDSAPHIRNNTKESQLKYQFVMYNHNNDDYIKSVFEKFHPGSANVIDILRDGMMNNTIEEAEFQASLVHKDYVIRGFYMYFLLQDTLSKVCNSEDTAVCVGEMDSLVLSPARKAMIDLLDKRAPNDWKQQIKQRYGCIFD